MMGDIMTVLVALVALCGVNMILIWLVATLAGSVQDVQYEVHSLKMWIARVARKDGGHDVED